MCDEPSRQWHSLYLHVDVLLVLVISTVFKGNSRSFDCLYAFEIGYPAALLKDQSHILLLIKRSVFTEDHDPHWFASFTLSLSHCVLPLIHLYSSFIYYMIVTQDHPIISIYSYFRCNEYFRSYMKFHCDDSQCVRNMNTNFFSIVTCDYKMICVRFNIPH